MKPKDSRSEAHRDTTWAEPDARRIAVANLSTRQFLVSPDGKLAAMDLPLNPDAQRIILMSLQVLGLAGQLPELAGQLSRASSNAPLWLIFDGEILAILLRAGVRTPALDALRPKVH